MVNDNIAPQAVSDFRLTSKIAEKRIREAALLSQNVIFSDHAFERMDERGITDIQVLDILRTGMVLEEPEKTSQGEWKCKIIKELRGRRDAGVIVIIITNGKLFLKTVEWEDLK